MPALRSVALQMVLVLLELCSMKPGEDRVEHWKEYVAAGDEAFHQNATWYDAQAVLTRLREMEGWGTELSNKKAQITELLRHQDVLFDKLAQAEQRVAWYDERAQALKRYMETKPPKAEAMTAVVTELVLHAAALTPPQPAPREKGPA